MRLLKSLIAIAAASTLLAGPAFAEDSRPTEMMLEGESPMLLSEERDYLTEEELLALDEAHGVDVYALRT